MKNSLKIIKLLSTLSFIVLAAFFISCGSNGISPPGLSNSYYWISMGSPGIGSNTPLAIAIDPSDNNPIVVFQDMDNWGPHVMKWDRETFWTDLGFPSTGVTTRTVLAIDPSDYKPVVAFVDTPTLAKVHVMKWSSGKSWTDPGFPSTEFSDSPSIVIDLLDNKPIVAFRDWASPLGADAHVKKWVNGTTWTGLGWPTAGKSVDPSITIDPSDNKPIVIYSDFYEVDAKVTVAKHP